MLTNSIEDNGVGSYGLAHGVTSDWEWADTTVDLMSEINVYGSNVWSSAGFDTGIKNMVFPGFSMNPLLKVINREDFWLSNVCTGSSFCFCVNNGRSDHGEAGRAFAVRPFFLIG